jgi:hypothetical protein
MYKGDLRKRNFALINVALVLASLNRQVFVTLFFVYVFSLRKEEYSRKLILRILPSITICSISFYLFYANYCRIFIDYDCYHGPPLFEHFPLLPNLSGMAFLLLFFAFPAFAAMFSIDLRDTLVGCSILLITSTAVIILNQNATTNTVLKSGGAVFIFRNFFGSYTVFFDTALLSFLIFTFYLLANNLRHIRWYLAGLASLALTLSLGPYAFQRYFEPYILILCLLVVSSTWTGLLANRPRLFNYWLIAMSGFQFTEFLLSCFYQN